MLIQGNKVSDTLHDHLIITDGLDSLFFYLKNNLNPIILGLLDQEEYTHLKNIYELKDGRKDY